MELPDLSAEWLETDGRGGFASGTVGGWRRRRYHALLLTDTELGRLVHVNGFDAFVSMESGEFPISTQYYSPDTKAPSGFLQLSAFTNDPWPTWLFRGNDGLTVRQEIFIPRDSSVVCLRWSLVEAGRNALLRVRPFLCGRDYHSLHHENPALSFDAQRRRQLVVWTPYATLPPIFAASNGAYYHQPYWYRNFLYLAERERGLDDTEDLAAPGEFRWSLGAGPAMLVLGTGRAFNQESLGAAELTKHFATLEDGERRRRAALGCLGQSADDYLVRRGRRQTIIAGYPWFTDWGRDTFIAIRGLCLANNRLEVARDILLSWADTVSAGMLPNRFPDDSQSPEYNSVDASLWYVIAVGEYLQKVKGQRLDLPHDREILNAAVQEILSGYASGTRYGIRMDDDGLIACGQPGTQLTWMDAKVGDWVATPRVGKPVEVQALWINALWTAIDENERWRPLWKQAAAAFPSRFWNAHAGCLYDVIDVDHRAADTDASLRPNQILAVGGLPTQVIEGDQARRIVDVVEQQLLTSLGLRSLAEDDPHYAGRYTGGLFERDAAYHQGTVWPWLLGPFVEAWVRVRGNTKEAKQTAKQRFLDPLESHLQQAGIGHISEIADGDAPHTPRGCPFQAWSLGEFLRLKNDVLATEDADD